MSGDPLFREGARVDYWNEDLRKAVRAMIPEVEGKPCNLGDASEQAQIDQYGKPRVGGVMHGIRA